MSEARGEEPTAQPLRTLRVERLLAIRDLARAAGVAPTTIFRIEAGRTVPRRAIMQRIAAALGVDPRAVAEFRDQVDPGPERPTPLPGDDQAAARRLEEMGYPPLLARRVVSPPT